MRARRSPSARASHAAAAGAGLAGRRYTNPYVVVRAIIERQHQDEPKHPRGTTDAEWHELADEYLDDDAAIG